MVPLKIHHPLNECKISTHPRKTCQVSKPITFNECHEIDALWHIFHSSMVLHKICMSDIYVWRCIEG